MKVSITHSDGFYVATSIEQPGMEGIGGSPDEALGHLVREVFLAEDRVSIEDISAVYDPI